MVRNRSHIQPLIYFNNTEQVTYYKTIKTLTRFVHDLYIKREVGKCVLSALNKEADRTLLHSPHDKQM